MAWILCALILLVRRKPLAWWSKEISWYLHFKNKKGDHHLVIPYIYACLKKNQFKPVKAMLLVIRNYPAKYSKWIEDRFHQ